MQHLSLFLLHYSSIFYHIYHHISLQMTKSISFNVFSKFRCCWISYFYKGYPIIIVKLTLSSISSALLTWSENQASSKGNLVVIVFIIAKECGKIFINCPNCLFGTKVNRIFEERWLSFLTRLQCTKTTSTDSNFGTFSSPLPLSMSYFTLPNKFTVSGVNNFICSLFLFWKQFCFWFYLGKFELAEFRSKFRVFWW